MRRATAWATKKATAQIGVEDRVPVVPGHVQRGLADVAAGIVHENVDMAEGVFGCRRHVLDAALIAHIQFERTRRGGRALRFLASKGAREARLRLVRTRSAPALARARAKVLAEAAAGPVTMATRPVRSKSSVLRSCRS